ncbi:MAG: DEAD/DEAH box helicase [Lentisphaeria bacterium]
MPPADIAEKFAHNFTEAQRELGGSLVAQAQCRQLWGGADRICCECEDNQGAVTCSLQLADNALQPQCECSDFQQGLLCRHLWAAILCARESHDLGLALKRTISKNIPLRDHGQGDSVAAVQDPRYDFEGRPRTRRGGKASSPDAAATQPRVVYDVPAVTHAAAVPPMPNFVLNEDTPIDILYVIRLEQQPANGLGLIIETWWRRRAAPGDTPSRAQPFVPEGETAVPTVCDRELLRLLWAAKASAGHAAPDNPRLPPQALTVPNPLLPKVLPMLVESRHARWLSRNEKPARLHSIVPTQALYALPAPFVLEVQPTANGYFRFTGKIQFSDRCLALSDCQLLLPIGYALSQNEFVPVDFAGAETFALELQQRGAITLNAYAARARIRQLALTSDLDLSTLPEALRHQRVSIRPTPQLFVRTARFTYLGREQLHAELAFDYDGARCDEQDAAPRLPGRLPGTTVIRDQQSEDQARERLKQLGFRWNRNASKEELGWKLNPADLDACVRALVMEDWLVQAEGKTYRKPVPKTAQLSSGMDWFDLKADTDFAGMTVSLPILLKAKREGKNAVRLDDGTYGILPIEWLENFTVLTEIGDSSSDKIRFRQEQAAIVDALLQDRQIEADERFRQRVTAITSAPPSDDTILPPSFQATLRPYQLNGLRWLLHMQRNGLGACLADDMGLGKTVQVLALLENRRCRPDGQRPSLIVMPKSLLFNWQAEAARFAPQLRLVVHAGSARQCRPDAFVDVDLVLTTYGTLRNDAIKLAKVHFDYCILDESQAIKNRDSATARAARVIKADHRLVMTGTPMENHLGELFSQLDFLNPGLVGAKLPGGTAVTGGNLSPDTLQRLRQGVRPFILRRTKQQVAKDLPPKSEQVIWCELDEQQQHEYDELKDFYRQALLAAGDKNSAGASAASGSIDALAALLRLRQAACHPGLLDEKRRDEGSAKLDLIEERILTLIDAEHKILVFSQFTSFLRIVQRRLISNSIDFCYLDGQTKDRATLVNSFQNDPAKQVFLISLKAGGVGLNLTAADYVFLLDPWWNPAVEAQAIDRAYRIGQTLPVFAYRIVTRDTVEEKVIKLQEQKRRLANAVLGKAEADSIEKRLSSEDLRFLLS